MSQARWSTTLNQAVTALVYGFGGYWGWHIAGWLNHKLGWL